MSRSLFAGACLAAVSAVALAQTPTRSTPPDPLDPQAAVPPAQYRSALAAYRPLAEAPVGSWKEANERVNRIGGWRAYAREAAAPAPTAPAAPAHRH